SHTQRPVVALLDASSIRYRPAFAVRKHHWHSVCHQLAQVRVPIPSIRSFERVDTFIDLTGIIHNVKLFVPAAKPSSRTTPSTSRRANEKPVSHASKDEKCRTTYAPEFDN
ncbi:hypothetical protein MPER_13730, partial [Moniliophthora perniciosa FA553]